MSKLRTVRLTGSKASHIGITRGILGQRLRNAGLARQSESRNPPRRAVSPLHLLHPSSRTLCVSLSLSSSRVLFYLLVLIFSPFFPLSFHREFPHPLPPPPPPLYPSFPPSPSSLTYVRRDALSSCFRPTYPNVPPPFLLSPLIILRPFFSLFFAISRCSLLGVLASLTSTFMQLSSAYPLFLFLSPSLSIYSCHNVIFSPSFVADC